MYKSIPHTFLKEGIYYFNRRVPKDVRVYQSLYKSLVGLLIVSIFIIIGLGKIGTAASFDCNKAKTDVEKGICNDPELSKLDSEIAEIYQKFDKNSKYYREIVKAQREWITKDRYLHDMEFTIQRDFLKWNLLLTNCMEKKIMGNNKLI